MHCGECTDMHNNCNLTRYHGVVENLQHLGEGYRTCLWSVPSAPVAAVGFWHMLCIRLHSISIFIQYLSRVSLAHLTLPKLKPQHVHFCASKFSLSFQGHLRNINLLANRDMLYAHWVIVSVMIYHIPPFYHSFLRYDFSNLITSMTGVSSAAQPNIHTHTHIQTNKNHRRTRFLT